MTPPHVPQTIGLHHYGAGAFTGGRQSRPGTSTDMQNHYEVQNLTSFFHGKHTLVVGGRLRDMQDSNSIQCKTSTGRLLSLLWLPTRSPNKIYRRCAANTCPMSGASQFLIVAGNPLTTVNMLDVGLFAQDDWKLRSNMTLSLGLRWESQTGISDHSDFAPRLGFAWGLSGHKNSVGKTVLRAGFGIFYDRFPETLTARSRSFEWHDPAAVSRSIANLFPDDPEHQQPSNYARSTPTRYEIDPHLQAPSIMQSAVSIEQQVSKSATVSLTYLNSHGTHQLFTNDINAPSARDLSAGRPATLGTRPYGNAAGNIYDYQSGGLFNQNQLIANFNLRLSTKLTLGGFYTLSYADADTNGNQRRRWS